jgi:hypothetical protein
MLIAGATGGDMVPFSRTQLSITLSQMVFCTLGMALGHIFLYPRYPQEIE